jgi:hypothetical protein
MAGIKTGLAHRGIAEGFRGVEARSHGSVAVIIIIIIVVVVDNCTVVVVDVVVDDIAIGGGVVVVVDIVRLRGRPEGCRSACRHVPRST